MKSEREYSPKIFLIGFPEERREKISVS